MDEKLHGFDIREQFLSPDELWNAARRATFLLLDDVRKPLSTDRFVWPSVFDTGQAHSLPPEQRERLHLNGFATPGWIGANPGIWDNLIRTRRTFDSNILLYEPTRYRLMAFANLRQ